ncbi:unnamed protein product [Ceutorhynchus assimilis]|uniref:Uncharacterized protein n=1 Tax=Ceutorhynchus assimilis TaxID=467358 RepID=A0A9N9QP01_9CUCU|nr:unnamed protein product [Ceutorhynchus assimilis]
MSVSSKNIESEGEVELSDGEYILDDNGFVCTSKSQKEISSSQDDRKTILDKLRSIQEGNPNIEAVFIEDEEDTKQTLAQPASSRSNGEETVESEEAENNISDEDTSSASETEYFHNSPKTASAKTSSTPNANRLVGKQTVAQNLSPKPNITSTKSTLSIPCRNPPPTPLIVKQVSPSTLTANFLKNSNRIVLNKQNGSGKEILVIPDEVLPFIASSVHPITLTVPGVGAVVLNKSNTVTPRPQPVPKPPVDPPTYHPLCDPKYQFWKYRKGIKRDLEGFSINDRLGFYRAEQNRSRICVQYYENTIRKMNKETEVLSRQFGLLPKSVEIPQVKKIRKARKKTIKKPKGNNLTPIQKKNLHVIKKWKEHFKKESENQTELSSSEDDENLLDRKLRLEREKKREAKKQKTVRKCVLNKKKSKKIKVERSPQTNPYLKKYKTYESTCKIINNLEDLELEMNPDQPVLVINEENYLSWDFEKLRLKNNLVYPSETEKA